MPESEINRENVRSNFRDAQHLANIIASVLTIFSCRAARAQEGALPPVNLGDTSFLDGIGLPGWLTEEIGQGVHEDRAFNSSGRELQQTTDVNSGSSLAHIAWISYAKLLGAWYGAETIISAAYVDPGSTGTVYGFGAITLGPVILQWPEHKVWGVPIYQRAVLDLSPRFMDFYGTALREKATPDEHWARWQKKYA